MHTLCLGDIKGDLAGLSLDGAVATSNHPNPRIPKICDNIIYKPPPPNVYNVNEIKLDI